MNKIINTSIQILDKKILTIAECENKKLFYSYGKFIKNWTLEEEYSFYLNNYIYWKYVVTKTNISNTNFTRYSVNYFAIENISTIDSYIMPLNETTREELVELLI